MTDSKFHRYIKVDRELINYVNYGMSACQCIISGHVARRKGFGSENGWNLVGESDVCG